MTHSPPDDLYDEATRRHGIEQAKALREQARVGGLHFEAYLPGGLAEWLLDQIERGVFVDPSEAVFVMLTEQRDLEPHVDLREEILQRSCQAAIDDPQRMISHEEVVEEMRTLAAAPRPAPATWRRRP
jgi:antitoxin ParD1/3/4